ncbi:hypothetical protein MRX96_000726 [Rhipicephalus microplus]
MCSYSRATDTPRRLFGTKCSKCRQAFCRTDFVMRARQHVYHLDCFRCQACERQLMPGDEFALREDGLFCRADHDVLDKFASSAHGAPPAANGIHVAPNAEPVPVGGGGVPRSGGQAPPAQPRGHPQSKQQAQHAEGGAQASHKPTRVRTVLNEKQLHTLRTCYAANPRPDALMKEQLVEMTGLSPRVIRVWFQNKRCKDKKKSLLMKQMQQHEKASASCTVVLVPRAFCVKCRSPSVMPYYMSSGKGGASDVSCGAVLNSPGFAVY